MPTQITLVNLQQQVQNRLNRFSVKSSSKRIVHAIEDIFETHDIRLKLKEKNCPQVITSDAFIAMSENLIDFIANSYDAGAENILITFSSTPKDIEKNGGKIKVSIEDSGPGFPPEMTGAVSKLLGANGFKFESKKTSATQHGSEGCGTARASLFVTKKPGGMMYFDKSMKLGGAMILIESYPGIVDPQNSTQIAELESKQRRGYGKVKHDQLFKAKSPKKIKDNEQKYEFQIHEEKQKAKSLTIKPFEEKSFEIIHFNEEDEENQNYSPNAPS
jgi:hypothetical protein